MKDNIGGYTIKILVFSRAFPDNKDTGAKVYLISLLEQFFKNGFQTELDIIDHSPGGRSPVHKIKSDILNFCSLFVMNNIRIKNFLFRTRNIYDLIIAPLGILLILLSDSDRKKIIDYLETRFTPLIKQLNMTNFFSPLKSRYRDYTITNEEKQFIKKRIRQFNPDIVIVNYVWLSGTFDVIKMEKNILKILLTHEVIHQRVESAKKYSINWDYSEWDYEKEARMLQKADLLISIHEDDKKQFEQMVNGIEVLSLPMPKESYSHYPHTIPGRCLFVGSYGDTNVHGLQWFLQQSWPIILRIFPECTLHICGTVCDRINKSYPNVNYLGFLDDLKSEYLSSEVFIAPLLFGSGLKIKLVEAISYGCACVSTNVGVQGLRETIDKAVLVADTAEDFAKSIVKILRNKELRRSMERQAEKYVKENLSPETVLKPLVKRMVAHVKEKPDLNKQRTVI